MQIASQKDNRKETPIKVFLDNLRTEQSETLSAMAARLGCTKQFLSRVERGERKLSKEIIERLVREYQLDRTKQREVLIAAKASPSVCIIDLSHLSYHDREKIIGIIEEKA